MKASDRYTLQKLASLLPYSDKVLLVEASGWGRTGHWDNWFHPISGWNYDLSGAVVEILADSYLGGLKSLGG